jgi:hypothetical protein
MSIYLSSSTTSDDLFRKVASGTTNYNRHDENSPNKKQRMNSKPFAANPSLPPTFMWRPILFAAAFARACVRACVLVGSRQVSKSMPLLRESKGRLRLITSVLRPSSSRCGSHAATNFILFSPGTVGCQMSIQTKFRCDDDFVLRRHAWYKIEMATTAFYQK